MMLTIYMAFDSPIGVCAFGIIIIFAHAINYSYIAILGTRHRLLEIGSQTI